MGLDVSPGGAHWSYTGFGRFRERLAEAEGFNLREMDGFRPFDASDTWAGKPWSEVESPLVPLLHHSDCDGYLDAYECEEILPRLREIVADWPAADYDREQANALIEGMEHCAEHGCALSFG